VYFTDEPTKQFLKRRQTDAYFEQVRKLYMPSLTTTKLFNPEHSEQLVERLNARNAALMANAQPFMETLTALKEICPVSAELHCGKVQIRYHDETKTGHSVQELRPALVITVGEMELLPGGHGIHTYVMKNGREEQLFPGMMMARNRSIQPSLLVTLHDQDSYQVTHYTDKKPINCFGARPDATCLRAAFATKLKKFLDKVAPEKTEEFAPIFDELRLKLARPVAPRGKPELTLIAG
jgi:hypothetical protein